MSILYFFRPRSTPRGSSSIHGLRRSTTLYAIWASTTLPKKNVNFAILRSVLLAFKRFCARCRPPPPAGTPCALVRLRAPSCALLRPRATSCALVRPCAPMCAFVRPRVPSCALVQPRAPSCDLVRPRATSCDPPSADPRFGVAPRIFSCEQLRIETELCRFGGLKFWSPYVCPIWVRPAFQAAKATQLRVNSRPEILVAICLPDLGATSISGRQSDTARCQFEALRTKIARSHPKSGIPVLQASGRVM